MTNLGHRELGPNDVRPDVPVVQKDHLDHLSEQLSFLDSSCDAYDRGARAEVKRLATTVRVLVHDTAKSTSLLRILDLKDRIPWADGIQVPMLKKLIEEQEQGREMAASLLTTIKMGVGFLQDHSLVGWVPVFEIQPLGERYVTFDYWWTTRRLSDMAGTAVSRKDIVLWLANKDGGAHVDRLPASYREIARNGSMGIRLSNLDGKTKLDESPIPAAMRQIAEEVRFSIRNSLQFYLDVQADMVANNYD